MKEKKAIIAFPKVQYHCKTSWVTTLYKTSIVTSIAIVIMNSNGSLNLND